MKKNKSLYLKEVCCNWLQAFDGAEELDFYTTRVFPQPWTLLSAASLSV